MTKSMHEKMRWWQDPETIALLKNSLETGQCSITSTDTILGLLGPFTQHGYEKINAIKGSRPDKPNLVLISSPRKLEAFVDTTLLSNKISALIEQCWPGPVTFIFTARPDYPKHLISQEGTIGLRCPNHQGLLTLLESFDGLFSTSANKSGQPSPESLEQVDPSIIKQIDYVVMDKDQGVKEHLPSTILDISDGKSIKVIRKGAYPVPDLNNF